MADLSLTVGQTFSADDYAEDTGQFLNVDFGQLASTGAVTITGQAPVFSNADVAAGTGGPALAAMITAIDPTASTLFGLGTVTIQGIDDSGNATGYPSYSGDILAESNGPILLDIEPENTQNSVDPYDGQCVLLSATSLSQSQNSPGQLDVTTVTYHHIELAEHDVVLTERLPAETFLDTSNRANFNDGTVMAAHPDFGTSCDLVFPIWEARGCARLVLTGPALDAARARIAKRARQKARRAA